MSPLHSPESIVALFTRRLYILAAALLLSSPAIAQTVQSSTERYSELLMYFLVIGLALAILIGIPALWISRRELQRSRLKFSTMFRNSPDLFAMTDRSTGRFLEVNDAFTRITGFTADEALGRTSTEIGTWASPEERQRMLDALGNKSRLENHETLFRRKSGDTFPALMSFEAQTIDGREVLLITARDITDRKRIEESLRLSEERFYKTFQSSPLPALIARARDGLFVDANANFERDFGWRREELIGRTTLELGLWPDPESRQKWLDVLTREGRVVDQEVTSCDKNGELREVSLSAETVSFNGEAHILSFAMDITGRKQAEQSVKLMASVFSNSNEGIMITDADNRLVAVNTSFVEQTGYTEAEVMGANPRMLSAGKIKPEVYAALWSSLKQTGKWRGELWDKRKNGEIYPIWLSISEVRDADGVIVNYIGSFIDITERKATEERVHHLAHHDTLTGLPNRFSLQERLEQSLGLSKRNNRQLALMLIDLDRFKTINDTLGHHVGDDLLLQVSTRLSGAVRESDIVARLGGDEFVVVLPEIVSPDDAAHVAEKIVIAVSEPYQIDGQLLRTSPSIGISIFPDDALDSEGLLKNADVAMYEAKASGRANYQFFTDSMTKATLNRMALEADLRDALEKDQFVLHYQPQLDLRTGSVTGVEALIRWRHPTRGLVAPNDFIPVAEETGLILPIGDWVLREACRQTRQWQDRGAPPVRISVNLSASQFADPELPDRIQSILEETGLESECLDLEVTESMSMTAPDKTIAMMKLLTSRGMTLSIDDFGTGYSSLAYLKLFPIRTLKIDRSFVKNIDVDAHSNDADICDVTVLLAHKLGLDVVAEGVETKAQLTFLLSVGCEKIQGYLISKPLPPDEAKAFIQTYSLQQPHGTVDIWSAS